MINHKLSNHLAAYLSLWDLSPHAKIILHSHSENIIYKICDDRYDYILRIHHPDYHDTQEILSELEWLQALKQDTDIIIPQPIMGKNEHFLQHIFFDGQHYNAILFHHIIGDHPAENTYNISHYFSLLGKIAATLHHHVSSWQYSKNFKRKIWHAENLFGKKALWGNWRNSEYMAKNHYTIIHTACEKLTENLKHYGKNNQNFGLIHADMRLANLLVHHDNIALIDFDDCGFGWFMYDFATTVSFFEDSKIIPKLKDSWCRAYQAIRHIDDIDYHAINDMMMARRLALLAWLHSHNHAIEASRLYKDFAAHTALMAQHYLALTR